MNAIASTSAGAPSGDPELTFRCGESGYMIFYRGQPIGGAGTLRHTTGREPSMHWRHRRANIRLFADAARREIARLKEGGGPQFMRDVMATVDQQPPVESEPHLRPRERG
jgi:hypothetical protein